MPPLLSSGTAKKLMAVGGAAAAGVAGFTARVDHPELAVQIPVSILCHAAGRGQTVTHYACAQRAALNQLLTNSSNITPFDKLTIRPVNDLLAEKNISLSERAYRAIVKDIHDSAQRPESYDELLEQLKTQTENQHEIAEAFVKSGETVGAIAHKALALGFEATHGLVQYDNQSTEAQGLKYDFHGLH